MVPPCVCVMLFLNTLTHADDYAGDAGACAGIVGIPRHTDTNAVYVFRGSKVSKINIKKMFS